MSAANSSKVRTNVESESVKLLANENADNIDNGAQSTRTSTKITTNAASTAPSERPEIGTIDKVLTTLAIIFFILTFPLSIWFAIKTCYEYERALIFCLGRLKYKDPKGPGVFFVLPFIETFVKVDLRTVSFMVPQQEILSKDSVTVEVDAVVYFKICDVISSICNVENAKASTKLLAQSTLRNMLGTHTLSEMLQNREQLSHQMQGVLDEATEPWGMKVERVEIKDIRLPRDMQRAMAAEAEATREAKAKIIAAQGEKDASEALREAALKMSECPAAIQLRFLQTLNTISAERNSTIVFPFPIDMFSMLMPQLQQKSAGGNSCSNCHCHEKQSTASD